MKLFIKSQDQHSHCPLTLAKARRRDITPTRNVRHSHLDPLARQLARREQALFVGANDRVVLGPLVPRRQVSHDSYTYNRMRRSDSIARSPSPVQPLSIHFPEYVRVRSRDITVTPLLDPAPGHPGPFATQACSHPDPGSANRHCQGRAVHRSTVTLSSHTL